ncbi:hypothetical protein HW114_09360 [Serratia symbiotica]|uniref:hypothetical protein n=1 Tax=Serratia symbiotica TaxID=138074 RepID=UPI001887B5A2|nr:hypothetical protein [Serratia symbiotica]MBF1995683.1 hypothetical protein [Serratia symbiotica]
MKETSVTQLLHSADPNYRIMFVGCHYINDDNDMTNIVDDLLTFYISPPTTKEILPLFEKSSDITLSGFANTDDNRKVFILSVKAGVLKSLLSSIAVKYTDCEAIIKWLKTSGESIKIVDIYIHSLNISNVI